MDRPLDQKTIADRKKRRLAALGAAVVLAALAILSVTGWIRPRVRRSDLRTARVERGTVEAVLTATGLVVPEYETVVVSPVDTRVGTILRKPGDPVEPGEVIVKLDRSGPEAELRKLDDQIALKRNARDQARLALENTLTDLRGRQRVQEIDRQALEQEKARNARLVELGALSRDAARNVEIQLEKVGAELDELEESMANARRDLDMKLKGLDLEISLLSRERAEAARRLDQVSAAATRGGVVTWVVPIEGASVRRGEEIARVADLKSYRVEATLSDVHTGRVARGMPARVRVGEALLDARITTVRPTVENGAITVEAALDQPSFPDLRPNLRADVYIVTDRKTGVLRLPHGAWLSLDGATAVFAIEGDRAVRRPVVFGIQSFAESEVTAGLAEGDEVIISDMSHLRDAREVSIR